MTRLISVVSIIMLGASSLALYSSEGSLARDVDLTKPNDAEACGEFWTPYVGRQDTSFDETSPNSVSSGCNLITICLTGNNPGGGSAQVQIYEITSTGSQNIKWARFLNGGWSGCYSPTISFTIGNNSKIRLVINNNSLEQVYQMNAG